MGTARRLERSRQEFFSSNSHFSAYTSPMPGKRAFEEQLAALDALRHGPEEARVEPLRKALGHRNNFIVAKAADLVREFRLSPAHPQPNCSPPSTASSTIRSRTTRNAGPRTPQPHAGRLGTSGCGVFLRGMRHIQMEPVWGGSPTPPELCAPPAPWRWCSAAALPNATCWRICRTAGRQRQNGAGRGGARDRTGRLAVGVTAALALRAIRRRRRT